MKSKSSWLLTAAAALIIVAPLSYAREQAWIVLSFELDNGKPAQMAFDNSLKPDASLDECKAALQETTPYLIQAAKEQEPGILGKAKFKSAKCILSDDDPIKPKEQNSLFERAWEKFDKGDFKSSEILFNQVIQQDPVNARAYHFRGGSRIKNYKYQEALEDLNEALKLDPSYTQTLCFRGNAKFSLGDVQGASKDLEECLTDHPNPGTYSDLARIKGMTGKFDEAIDLSKKAIALAPSSKVPEVQVFAYTNLASAYAAKGQYKESLEASNKAIELNPEFADAYTSRAIVKMEMHDVQGAIADFNKAIEINPKDANAYYNRAIFNSKTGDTSAVYADLVRARQFAIETKDTKLLDAATAAIEKVKPMMGE